MDIDFLFIAKPISTLPFSRKIASLGCSNSW
jgi:hypothetical protein